MAAAAGVSKRTLYARFSGKAPLLQAAVAQLIERWLPRFDAELAYASGLEAALLASARVMLATALMPEALALHRLIVSEIGRFPELATVMRDAGAGVGTERIAAILAAGGIADADWAAEQFMALVLSVPQRRAMGHGPAMDEAGREAWAIRAVALFLRGIASMSQGGGARHDPSPIRR